MKVGLVEDDVRLARAVTAALEHEGYRVRAAGSAREGLEMLRQWSPDLVLLDLMLPDNQGPELFTRFRSETAAGLVGMTARSSLADVVAGLHAGADDYLAKPFSLDELSARVSAVLRRVRSAGAERLEVNDIALDLGAGQAWRGGRELVLTGIEFRILAALLRNAGRVLSQSQLAEAVWATESWPSSNSVEVHLGRLRRKLEAGGESRVIHTFRGMGYALKWGARR